MLHFLSSLFKPAIGESGTLDRGLIEAATERAIDGTDPRLRALGNYRKRLREPVEQAAQHIISLVDGLPPAVEISRRSYGSDPRLRAFFVSADHLDEFLRSTSTVRDYLKGSASPLPDTIFGLLTLTWKERTVLGTEQNGEIQRRDVKQQAVSFFDHRFVSPAGDESGARWEMKKRGYDYLIRVALEKILAARGKHEDLKRERQLLNRKLEAMKTGGWGLEAMFSHDKAEPTDPAALEAQIDAVEKELLTLGADTVSLEHSLDRLAEVLGQPEHWLSLRELSMRLNYMGIRVEEHSAQSSTLIDLIELYSVDGLHRILLPAYIPRTDLPEKPDFFKAAQRYLG
jgi:hypothetical protein